MSRSKPMRFLFTLIIALGFGILPLAGAAHASSTQTWYVAAGFDTGNHAIQGMTYLPDQIWIHQGDTVVWQANSGEPHTVTFVPSTTTTLPALIPCGLAQTPETTFDGSTFDTSSSCGSYLNSGFLTTMAAQAGLPPVTSYSLTFTATGDFTYYCLVHHASRVAIPGMQGIVHVVSDSTPLPYTQAQYTAQDAVTEGHIIAEGAATYAQEEQQASNHLVFAGGTSMDGLADLMRFIRPVVVVHVGQSVTFKNTSMAPHTVTFGPEEGDTTVPYGDSTNYTGGPLNSGYFGSFISSADTTYSVTFGKVGTYTYVCALHDYMGMTGEVIVVP